MTEPKKDIDRLQREIDDVRTDADRAPRGAPPKPVVYKPQNLGLDAVLTGAGMLVILGLSVSLASQLTKDQVTALTAGSVGAAGALVVGYTVGRKRVR
tara:strand:- start:34 stop:327 length:294 start_codon:yes stop_codon:yes gene_type:complete